jgi:hypothetical protein
MLPPTCTTKQLHPSVYNILTATSCKSTGTFFTSVCTPAASSPAVARPSSKYKTAPHCYNRRGVAHDQPLHWPYFVAGFFAMKTDDLEKQVKLLSVLVDGCKKRPAYRAIRPLRAVASLELICGRRDRN